ncbi:MAG TPA: GAF domain-containing protein [Terriglobales bacterium]|nr:GAF domain-containing protein [Terriglobales bacterium]
MPETISTQEVVERAVSQVIESQRLHLQEQLVRRVLEALEVEPTSVGHGAESTASGLLKAVCAIYAGSTQKEILRTLLDNTVRYSGRAALFIVKGSAGTGWQGRGFSNNDEIKDFALDVTNGLAGRAVQSRMVFTGSASEMDASFKSRFRTPSTDRAIVLPLLLKDKVAALVYADGGVEPNGHLDPPALELLVVASGAWLEVNALRKQANKEGQPEAAAAHAAPEKSQAPPAVQAASPSFDPFASHAPMHAAAAVASASAAEQPAMVAVSEAPAVEVLHDAPPVEEAPAPAPPSGELSAEDAEVHKKAQRFARLLVDEIKLYNQQKVTEGRETKDLYDRLKEDIDKSRATYDKRYGSTVAAGAGYFQQALIQNLAGGDASVMGGNFPL